MRYAYAVEIERGEDGVTVTSPDVPEMVTYGSNETEAVERAADALVSALSFYVEDARTLPKPRLAGGRVVSVPALAAAKFALHDAMIEAGLSNVELARRLGLDEKSIRRLRDPLHRSHIGQVEAALASLGKKMVVEIGTAA